jgi:hypothetical protein
MATYLDLYTQDEGMSKERSTSSLLGTIRSANRRSPNRT